MRRIVLILTLMPLIAAPAGCTWLGQALGVKPAPPPEPTPEQRRQSYVDEHPDTSIETREAILAGSLVEGMSSEHVRASLGRPASISVILPSSPEDGDEQWLFEEIAYGTSSSFEGGREHRTRIFSGVRDTRVRFWSSAVVGVDDMGYTTRNDLVASCQSGVMESCDRVDELDSRAASAPPPEA